MNTSFKGFGRMSLPSYILSMLVAWTMISASLASNQDGSTLRHTTPSSENSLRGNLLAILSDLARQRWEDFWQRGSFGSLGVIKADERFAEQVSETKEDEDETRGQVQLDVLFAAPEKDVINPKRTKRRMKLKTSKNDQKSPANKQRLREQRRTRQRNKFMKTIARNKNKSMNVFASMRSNVTRSAAGESASSVTKPNIIFIVADDLGYNDVPWHNPDVQAPNLLRLARKGVLLENHYVLPLCTPSRAALLTGDYSFRHGKQAGESSPLSPTGLNASLTLFPQRLKDLGYSTHLIGTRRGFDSFYGFYLGSQTYYTQYKKLGHKKVSQAWLDRNEVNFDPRYLTEAGYPTLSESLKEEQLQQIRSDRSQQLQTLKLNDEHNGGRDFRLNETPLSNVSGIYSNELYATRAEKLIREHAVRVSDAQPPLFLMLSMQAVHGPVEVPLHYRRKYKSTTRNLARRTFLGMVSALDEVVGRVVNQLKASGLYHNTIIVFTTDNGGNIQAGGNNFPLRGSKGSVFEGGTRGVAFIHSPLLPKSGYKYTGIMHIVDWHDTLLHVARSGASLSRGTAERNSTQMTTSGETPDVQQRKDSMNLWPAIISNTRSPRQSFVYNVRKKPLRGAIRRKNWKLIIGEGGRYDGWVPPSDVNAGSNREMRRGRCCSTWNSSTLRKHVMLYNLKDDPLETTDVSHLHPDVTATLKSRLRQYAAESRHPYMPPEDPLGHPSLHGGFFSPGWCQAQR